jgi:hypothetical protein
LKLRSIYCDVPSEHTFKRWEAEGKGTKQGPII